MRQMKAIAFIFLMVLCMASMAQQKKSKNVESEFMQIDGINVPIDSHSKYITKSMPDSTVMNIDTTRYERDFILFPNAFRPDKSGQIGGQYLLGTYNNNVFHPTTDQDIDEYQLLIYNRYGYLVFESTDINIGWDGYFENRLMPQDGYFYVATGRFVTTGAKFSKWGQFIILL